MTKPENSSIRRSKVGEQRNWAARHRGQQWDHHAHWHQRHDRQAVLYGARVKKRRFWNCREGPKGLFLHVRRRLFPDRPLSAWRHVNCCNADQDILDLLACNRKAFPRSANRGGSRDLGQHHTSMPSQGELYQDDLRSGGLFDATQK